MSEEFDIARVRRFNRAVTTALGAMDQSFLGRGRPLGVARALNAIGQGYRELRDLRAYLGVDSGLMSRTLRALESEGLIETEVGAGDARQRILSLTEAGRREFEAYEALSDTAAKMLLARGQERDAMLAALDLLSATLRDTTAHLREADPAEPGVRHAMQEYMAELTRRFGREFAVTPMSDAERRSFLRPQGVFLLAEQDGLAVASGALRPLGEGIAEVKRMWVNPAWRGRGLSRQLMAELERQAQGLGYRALRLDTSRHLGEAVGLYRALGYSEISRYNDNPDADHFFEKTI